MPLLLHGADVPTPADVAVVEGVMGLFDGRIGSDGFASTAHVAGLIGAPVVLVLDISQVSRTAAASCTGCTRSTRTSGIAGVILNKAGSARHADEVVRVGGDRHPGARACCRATPGSRRRPATWAWCRRPSDPMRPPRLDRLAGRIAEHVDLTAGAVASPTRAPDWSRPRGTRPRLVGSGLGRTGRSGGRWSRSPAAGVHLPLRRDRPSCSARPAASR